ncbi:putative motility protein [Sporosarcina gallistercoris]|uniref:Motility protein n=1 Tax=Sporosarcina gallistercoris TaxID=2762245 RepID=A0ABR8PHW7_9BACL|nr:putative motility protein [Sporosarcina gallistercoris]MBD7907760.1 putative motility protein [Sporosarcina gallistercoris]
MDISSIMAGQLRSLQSTVQMTILDKAMTANASAATEMLQSLPEAAHPFKGSAVDIKA